MPGHAGQASPFGLSKRAGLVSPRGWFVFSFPFDVRFFGDSSRNSIYYFQLVNHIDETGNKRVNHTKKSTQIWTQPARISTPLPTAPHTQILTNEKENSTQLKCTEKPLIWLKKNALMPLLDYILSRLSTIRSSFKCRRCGACLVRTWGRGPRVREQPINLQVAGGLSCSNSSTFRLSFRLRISCS